MGDQASSHGSEVKSRWVFFSDSDVAISQTGDCSYVGRPALLELVEIFRRHDGSGKVGYGSEQCSNKDSYA